MMRQGRAETVRFKDLKGKPVIARLESQRLGSVDDILFSPDDGRIGAIALGAEGITGIVTEAFAHAGGAVMGDAVEVIGPDAVIVTNRHAAVGIDSVDRTELVSGRELAHKSVFTDAGEQMNRVEDVVIDVENGRVYGYIIRVVRTQAEKGTVAGEGGAHAEIVVPVAPDVRVGRDLITVPAGYATSTRQDDRG